MQADSTTIYFSYYLLTIMLSMVHNCFQIRTNPDSFNALATQAQIWFTARNAPVKTSKVFVHYFFLSPVCKIYTMPPAKYYVVNRKTGMVGFEPTTY